MEEIKSIGERETSGMMTKILFLSGIRKASLFFMIVMVISFVSGLDFSFSSPESVGIGEEFEVTISGTTDDVYDVKIYVHDDVKASSEIYDGSTWKSTHFYLKDVFPDQEVFKLRAHVLGDSEVCVQMRKSGGSAFDKLCEDISVEESNTEEENSEDSDEEKKDDDPETEDEKAERVESSQNLIVEDKPNEKIILNMPKTENTEERTFVSKQGRVRSWVLYGFAGLLVLIVVFMALRKL